jgi:hypothetical protein
MISALCLSNQFQDHCNRIRHSCTYGHKPKQKPCEGIVHGNALMMARHEATRAYNTRSNQLRVQWARKVDACPTS